MSFTSTVTEDTLSDGSTVYGVRLTDHDWNTIKFDCVSEQQARLLDVALRQSVYDFTAQAAS